MISTVLTHIDAGRALLALVISVALYSVVEHEQNPPEIASFDLRVDLVNVPSGLVVMSDQATRSVTFRISAPRDAIANLRHGSLRAYVDLTKASAGADQYPVSVDVP